MLQQLFERVFLSIKDSYVADIQIITSTNLEALKSAA